MTETRQDIHQSLGGVQEGSGEEEARVAPVPEALNRNLRCCVPCRLVKTLEQFFEQGCENCHFLDMEGDRERIEDCTTTEFHVRVLRIALRSIWI